MSFLATLAVAFPAWGQSPAPSPTTAPRDVATPAGAMLKPIVGLSLREGYDSNVYLQNSGPLGDRSSWVTTLTPTLGLTWVPEPAQAASEGRAAVPAPLTITGVYAPSRVQFHNEPGESYWDHQLRGEVGVAAGRWTASGLFSLRIVDGDHELPLYTGQGGLPAAGAPSVRDRRDQTVFRGAVKAQYTADAWFVRPVASGWVQDFHVTHNPTPGFCNFVDRSDANVGLDAGLKVLPATFVTAGYRLGHQSQDTIFANPTNYANDYQRFLVGLEGKPTSWLKLAVQAGPDLRRYTDDTPATFDRRQTELYLDACLTVTPTPDDEFTLVARKFDQPGAGGRSIYADATYSLTYRRKLTPKLTGSIGGKAYNTDFEYPAKRRDDWVYTAETSLTYKIDAHWSLEAGFLYEAGQSDVPAMPSRDYDRTFTYVGVGWSF